MKKKENKKNNNQKIIFSVLGFLVLGLLIGILFSTSISTTGQAKSAVVPAPRVNLYLNGALDLYQVYSPQENDFKNSFRYYANYNLQSNLPATSSSSFCFYGGTDEKTQNVCTQGISALEVQYNPQIGGYYQSGTTRGFLNMDDYNPFIDISVINDLIFNSGEKRGLNKSIHFNSNQDPFAKVTALEITGIGDNFNYYLSHTNAGEIDNAILHLEILPFGGNEGFFSWDAVSIGNNTYGGNLPSEVIDALNNASDSFTFEVTSIIITASGNSTIATKYYTIDPSTKKIHYLPNSEVERLEAEKNSISEK